MDSPSEIRFTGAVYTPVEIAKAIVSYVKSIIDPDKALNILEPSVGDGSFLKEIFPVFKAVTLTAVDIDKSVIDQLTENINYFANPISFITKDFLQYSTSALRESAQPFDLIIGNPPFIRKHNFSDEFKNSIKELSEICEYPLKDLKNSWVAFLIACSRMVSDNGIVALILPYELMTVDYGQKALHILLMQFDRIDIVISKNKAFPDIEQDAVIFVGQKSCKTNGLYVNRVNHMANLSSPEIHKLNFMTQLGRGLELSAFLLPNNTLDLLRNLQARCASIDHYAGSAPGIVSAANDFFILTKSKVTKLGLQDYVIPILKKGSYASPSPMFTAHDFSEIEISSPCYLLNIKEDFEKIDEKLKAYIKEGEALGLHLRYKCRNRKNWYNVPIVPKELGFVFKRSHVFPRVCLNDADVYLTDTAYGIRVKDGFTIRGLCFSFYNSLTLLFTETNGRFYGGGVLELSPTEFRGLPLVYHEPTDEEFSNFLKIHDGSEENVLSILDFGDQWLKRKLDLTDEQLIMIRQGWFTVRAHRMRHGSRSNQF
ncbi:MAG: N-6 DNA methylase [Methylophilaceae bacterium]|nr:N-6 DNA methylase [Methyloradius sp.]